MSLNRMNLKALAVSFGFDFDLGVLIWYVVSYRRGDAIFPVANTIVSNVILANEV
jgi:hypothetical protein